jgi:hypothetical protein
MREKVVVAEEKCQMGWRRQGVKQLQLVVVFEILQRQHNIGTSFMVYLKKGFSREMIF